MNRNSSITTAIGTTIRPRSSASASGWRRASRAAKSGPTDGPDANEVYAWAIGGMNVFLGIRFGLWDTGRDPAEIARIANGLLARGLAAGAVPSPS